MIPSYEKVQEWKRNPCKYMPKEYLRKITLEDEKLNEAAYKLVENHNKENLCKNETT